MERIKILPRHLLLLVLPILAAIIGGMLVSGNLSAFLASYGGRGISQAQLFLGLSILTGSLAFSLRCLTKTYSYAIMIFLPLILGVVVMPQLGPKASLILVYSLNLALTVSLWMALKYTFFANVMIRFRTAAFAFVAAALLTAYFRLLFLSLSIPFLKENWSGYFWNSLFLFIFIGFGLSLADIVIIRKEVAEQRLMNRHADIYDEDDDDNR
jgi:hypothetical protein